MAQDWVTSPLGAINFEANKHGLVRIGWGEVLRKNPEDPTIVTTRKWISNYFEGINNDLPIFSKEMFSHIYETKQESVRRLPMLISRQPLVIQTLVEQLVR